MSSGRPPENALDRERTAAVRRRGWTSRAERLKSVVVPSRLRARLNAFAIATTFLLGAVLPAMASIGCVRGNLLRSECCCHAEAEAPSRVDRRCCCEVDAPATPNAPRTDEVTASPRGPETSSVALAPHAGAVLAMPAPSRVAGPRLAPATGPPLILLKRSFLI